MIYGMPRVITYELVQFYKFLEVVGLQREVISKRIYCVTIIISSITIILVVTIIIFIIF